MAFRGSSQFEITSAGDLVDSDANAELLRRLWLDRSVIDGPDLGPGNPGDFDDGALHVACHLLGAGGVRRLANGRIAWLELSYEPASDEYFASITTENGAASETLALAANAGILDGSTLLGYVEGNSTGHISARGVVDSKTRFNDWVRQDFDRDASDTGDGGKVWEHWCTVRKLRIPDRTGRSVIRGYISLAAALGDRFLPTVARGRRDYGHPKQLVAMTRAGLTSEASALWDTNPKALPTVHARQLSEARPGDSLSAVTALSWDDSPLYYMFPRRISKWSSTASVHADLRQP